MAEPHATTSPANPTQHVGIFLGLVVGVVAGLAINFTLGGDHRAVAWIVRNLTEPTGTLFLRLLLLTVIPLIFSSLIVGVAGLGDFKKVGRVGLKCLVYSLAISAISVGIGVFMTNTLEPGKRIAPEVSAALQTKFAGEAEKRVESTRAATNPDSAPMQVVKSFVPSNPVASLASETPNLLHLMVFALLLAVAMMLIPRETTEPFIRTMESLQAISGKLIDLIMKVAPAAVACLLFNNVARFGFDLLVPLAAFFLTVLAGLALHCFGVYSVALRFVAGVSPVQFFRKIKTVMLTAFSTSSSNATLPTTLRVSEDQLGVPREINSFVLTIGATANQNGTALFEGVTVLFLAQLAGVDLSLGQQILVAYLAILGSIGTAGVPAASIPFIIVVLSTIGVNPALIAIVLGVDRILDMCRTVVNVVGDLTAAVFVAKSEGYKLKVD